MLLLLGDVDLMSNEGSTTLISVVAVSPLAVLAVIVAVPGAIGDTTPALLIVATCVLSLLQVIDERWFDGVKVAFNCVPLVSAIRFPGFESDRPVGLVPKILIEHLADMLLSTVAIRFTGDEVGWVAVTLTEVPLPLKDATDVLDKDQLIDLYSASDG